MIAQDSYKLVRKVEMFQWTESYHPAQGSQPAYYSYQKVWTDVPQDSQKFKNIGFNNPSIDRWVFKSKQFTSSQIKLGKFFLNKNQKKLLGAGARRKINWSQEDMPCFYEASQ